MTLATLIPDIAPDVLPQNGIVYDQATIAALTLAAIAEMSADDLIGIVRGADLPHASLRHPDRLRFMNRPDLERLACLARRCCRNRGH